MNAQTTEDNLLAFPQTATGTKQVLSVSGGGLLGVIPAAMLTRFEALGQDAYGPDYRLCHSFDHVGGASTGAIIATGIALGLTAGEIADFYLKDAPRGFRRRRWAIPGLHDVLDDVLLKSYLTGRTGDRLLRRADLACDLTIMVKNLSTGTPTAFSTTHEGKAPVQSLGAELRGDALRLDDLLRASTAAPGLFRPVSLPIGPDGAENTCIDGGIGPFNNPAFLLATMTQQPRNETLNVTSLGTGSVSRPGYKPATGFRETAFGRVLGALCGTIADGEHFASAALESLANLAGSHLTCQRHDIDLGDASLLASAPDLSRTERRKMRNFASPEGKARLFDIASEHASCMITKALPLSVAGRNALTAGFDHAA